MKKYEIEITLNTTGFDYHVLVNGKEADIPKRLKKAIAQKYLQELLLKD